MAAARQVLIIGGGHNGLVAAFYLAQAGLRPLVLERRQIIGGAACSEEFHPGFKCSALAHSCSSLLPAIQKDMRLARHGLEMLEPAAGVLALSADGRGLLLAKNPAEAARNIERVSPADAANYLEFGRILSRYGAVLADLLRLTPPAMDKPSSSDLWHLLQLGRKVRRLGKKDMMRLLRWGPMAAADLAPEFFSHELLRAVVAARGIFGTAMGPWSAGTAAHMLLQAASDPAPAGGCAFPRGGMGALSASMAAAAAQAGAEIRTSAEISSIAVKEGAVTGVVLASGEEISARTVVSSADPKRTFLKLLNPAHLAPDFLVKIRNYRCSGTVAKLNFALDALPEFKIAGDLSMDARQALAGRIHVGPDIDYLERAFDACKYGEFSRQPCLDITIPSLADSSLAPAGKHVMSVCMQFAPYHLKNRDWACSHDALADVVVDTIAEYAPNISSLIVGGQILTPRDLEEKYALTGGHIFHGELALDQLFSMRPVLGWARYRTPVRGLYLCGSGTHPGTGLTGASGANAAREILKDLKK